MTNRFEEQARELTSVLQLSAPPIAIAFHAALPAEPELFDGPMPPPAPDGRTGRVPAGNVFWMHGTARSWRRGGLPRPTSRRSRPST